MQNIKSKDNEKYQVSLLTAFNCTKTWKVFNLINYMTINIPNNTCSAVKKRHYFLLPCTAILSNWEGQKAEFKSIDLPLRLFCSAGSTIYIFLFLLFLLLQAEFWPDVTGFVFWSGSQRTLPIWPPSLRWNTRSTLLTTWKTWQSQIMKLESFIQEQLTRLLKKANTRHTKRFGIGWRWPIPFPPA